MNWTLRFSEYVASPCDAWPQDRNLQARKLHACSTRHCEAGNVALARMLERIVDRARARAAMRTPSLFLINCGSSGSHWVEAMLSALPGIHACGEVYVPPRLGEELASAPGDDRRCLLDALHQVHLEPSATVGDRDVLINSAHSWNPHDLMGDTAIAVVLIRDPLDVVASRTYRKPRLRRHVAPAANDEQYLEQNIVKVEKFYRSAMRRKPQHVIRYERLLAEPVATLSQLAELVRHPAPTTTLAGIADRFSAESQAGSGQRLSNVFRGPRAASQPMLAHAAARLARLRADLGYA